MSFQSTRYNNSLECADADAVLLLRMLHFVFFVFVILLFHRNLRLLLFPGNKRDRIKTLTQWSMWSMSWSITFLASTPYSSKLFTALSLQAHDAMRRSRYVRSCAGVDWYVFLSGNPRIFNADRVSLHQKL